MVRKKKEQKYFEIEHGALIAFDPFFSQKNSKTELYRFFSAIVKFLKYYFVNQVLNTSIFLQGYKVILYQLPSPQTSSFNFRPSKQSSFYVFGVFVDTRGRGDPINVKIGQKGKFF